MKIRMSIAAAGAAAFLGTAALVVPATASAHSESHTLSFTALQKASIMFTQTTGGEQDTDVNNAGKTIGFDMVYFRFTSATTIAGNLTIDTTGGFLYGTFTVNTSTGVISNGKVTGGTGRFAEAEGTIQAKNLNSAGTRTAVTVTYST